MVAYNAVAHISSCIDSIMREMPEGDAGEILLLDNGDGSTQDLVRGKYPQVTIIPPIGNIGYGAGNNLLAQHATGDLLVIINPDAQLESGALAALGQASQQLPDTAAFAAWFKTPTGQSAPENNILRPGVLSSFALAIGLGRAMRRLTSYGGGRRAISAASGACFAIRREWFEKLGGFDTRFFLYFEETDFFRRLAEQGGKLVRIPGFTIVHDAGAGHSHSIARRQANLRGYMTYCRKHFGPVRAFLCGLAIWLFALRTAVIRHGFRDIGEIMPRNWWQGWTRENDPRG
ncbi:glycosyltransferase family 2 protein [Erythrobacteraceae bacterium E2-1 Yellow Sea]|nr:glycosyltransferase family 2 protein [Erythrobacteraceae bacterium E2-1 Yellow Sea]